MSMDLTDKYDKRPNVSMGAENRVGDLLFVDILNSTNKASKKACLIRKELKTSICWKYSRLFKSKFIKIKVVDIDESKAQRKLITREIFKYKPIPKKIKGNPCGDCITLCVKSNITKVRKTIQRETQAIKTIKMAFKRIS